MGKFLFSALTLVACGCFLSVTGCSTERAPAKPTTFGAKPGPEATPGKKQTMDSKSNIDTSVGTVD